MITYKTSAVIEVNEFRKTLILWARNQATGQRTSAAIAHRKGVTDTHNAKAESYDFVAKYLEGMEIVELQPAPKPIKICPDTKRDCEENCSGPDCHINLSKRGFFDPSYEIGM